MPAVKTIRHGLGTRSVRRLRRRGAEASVIQPVRGTAAVQVFVSKLDSFLGTELFAASEPIVVGRHRDAQLRLLADGVSREHLRITVDAGRLFVEDLDSANGTLVNRRRIGARTEIRPADAVQVGPYTLRVRALLPRPERAPSGISDADTAVEAVLSVDSSHGTADAALDVARAIDWRLYEDAVRRASGGEAAKNVIHLQVARGMRTASRAPAEPMDDSGAGTSDSGAATGRVDAAGTAATATSQGRETPTPPFVLDAGVVARIEELERLVERWSEPSRVLSPLEDSIATVPPTPRASTTRARPPAAPESLTPVLPVPSGPPAPGRAQAQGLAGRAAAPGPAGVPARAAAPGPAGVPARAAARGASIASVGAPASIAPTAETAPTGGTRNIVGLERAPVATAVAPAPLPPSDDERAPSITRPERSHAELDELAASVINAADLLAFTDESDVVEIPVLAASELPSALGAGFSVVPSQAMGTHEHDARVGLEEPTERSTELETATPAFTPTPVLDRYPSLPMDAAAIARSLLAPAGAQDPRPRVGVSQSASKRLPPPPPPPQTGIVHRSVVGTPLPRAPSVEQVAPRDPTQARIEAMLVTPTGRERAIPLAGSSPRSPVGAERLGPRPAAPRLRPLSQPPSRAPSAARRAPSLPPLPAPASLRPLSVEARPTRGTPEPQAAGLAVVSRSAAVSFIAANKGHEPSRPAPSAELERSAQHDRSRPRSESSRAESFARAPATGSARADGPAPSAAPRGRTIAERAHGGPVPPSPSQNDAPMARALVVPTPSGGQAVVTRSPPATPSALRPGSVRVTAGASRPPPPTTGELEAVATDRIAQHELLFDAVEIVARQGDRMLDIATLRKDGEQYVLAHRTPQGATAPASMHAGLRLLRITEQRAVDLVFPKDVAGHLVRDGETVMLRELTEGRKYSCLRLRARDVVTVILGDGPSRVSFHVRFLRRPAQIALARPSSTARTS